MVAPKDSAQEDGLRNLIPYRSNQPLGTVLVYAFYQGRGVLGADLGLCNWVIYLVTIASCGRADKMEYLYGTLKVYLI